MIIIAGRFTDKPFVKRFNNDQLFEFETFWRENIGNSIPGISMLENPPVDILVVGQYEFYLFYNPNSYDMEEYEGFEALKMIFEDCVMLREYNKSRDI